jgi:hypothetical protein
VDTFLGLSSFNFGDLEGDGIVLASNVLALGVTAASRSSLLGQVTMRFEGLVALPSSITVVLSI